MLFWILVAVLTAVVGAVLLHPLLRGAKEAGDCRAGEAEVYRDQLRELDRDLAGGLISTEEAGYARAEIGRRLIDGALAFAAGDYRRTVEAILPVRDDAARIGGSHAQRDIINLTLIAAAQRSGERSLARALLAERRRSDPNL